MSFPQLDRDFTCTVSQEALDKVKAERDRYKELMEHYRGCYEEQEKFSRTYLAERDHYKALLARALGHLIDMQRKYAPNAPHSLVDDFVARHYYDATAATAVSSATAEEVRKYRAEHPECGMHEAKAAVERRKGKGT
jgi:hypothetical protein